MASIYAIMVFYARFMALLLYRHNFYFLYSREKPPRSPVFFCAVRVLLCLYFIRARGGGGEGSTFPCLCAPVKPNGAAFVFDLKTV